MFAKKKKKLRNIITKANVILKYRVARIFLQFEREKKNIENHTKFPVPDITSYDRQKQHKIFL